MLASDIHGIDYQYSVRPKARSAANDKIFRGSDSEVKCVHEGLRARGGNELEPLRKFTLIL